MNLEESGLHRYNWHNAKLASNAFYRDDDDDDDDDDDVSCDVCDEHRRKRQ